MEPKSCLICRVPHFNEWDLCSHCAGERQQELERRLQEDDGAEPYWVIAVRAMYGSGYED